MQRCNPSSGGSSTGAILCGAGGIPLAGEDVLDRGGIDDSGCNDVFVQESQICRGRGAFALGKPRPVEYHRDVFINESHGFLTKEQSDRMWDEKSEGSDYIMEVTAGIGVFRDEVYHGGQLRHIEEIEPLIREGRFSQRMHLDGTLAGPRTIYIANLDPTQNPIAFANDRVFGHACADSQAELYESLDVHNNNMVSVPCLRLCPTDPTKVEFNAVFAYPRRNWKFQEGVCTELTLGYFWPLNEYLNSRICPDDEARAPIVNPKAFVKGFVDAELTMN